MYAFLIFTPIFNFVDAIFNLVPDVDVYLLIIHISYGLTALITAYLAIKHFITMSKRRLDNGN